MQISKETEAVVVSGFHSRMEKNVLKILLQEKCGIIIVLARGMYRKILAKYIDAMKQLFEDLDWSESILPLIEYNRKTCQQLLDFWKSEYGYPIDDDINFSTYANGCAHFKCWDVEDLFDATMDKLIAMGYNKDEVDFVMEY